jgi:hypothetical protein
VKDARRDALSSRGRRHHHLLDGEQAAGERHLGAELEALLSQGAPPPFP